MVDGYVIKSFCFNNADTFSGVAEGRTDSPLLSEEQWTSLSKRTGFSGLDICLRDSSDEEMWTMSMTVSTKEKGNAGFDPVDIRITYDSPEEQQLVNLLAKDFERYSSTKPLISTLSDTVLLEQLIVTVHYAKGSRLLNLDERKLEVLKSIFAQAKGVLWVTFGGSGNDKDAGAGAVSGFLRVIRAENGGMNYVACNVENEELSNPELVEVISKVFSKAFSNSNMNSPEKDLEYAVQNGRIMIPRLVEDKLANTALIGQSSKREPEDQSLWQEDSCLSLDMGHVGLLDTFQFVHHDTCSSEIHHDEVEIEVKTAGLNFHDLLVATGQLPDQNRYGCACAGIITTIGKAIHHFKTGDRVGAIASPSFANRVRVSQDLVSIMPDTMTFETGASISAVFTTSYYYIHHAARLRK